jgi:iron complex transport system substrate-binding protein
MVWGLLLRSCAGRSLHRLGVPAFAGTLLSACAPTAPLPDEGTAHPTLVSLNPCSDAVLAEVARPGQLLAISHFSQDPASSSMDLARAMRFRAVSGSAEEVLALRPDMVVADPFLAPATRAALAQSGIAVVSLPIARSIDESRAQVRQLARLARNEAAGRALNRRIDAALARAAPPHGSATIRAPVKAIVWQAGGIVPGRDTLIADLLARTGFVLASAARGMGQADHLPLETLLADPPVVLFVAANTRAQENRSLAHPVLDRLAGTRRVPFDASLLWCGGPTLERAAQRLAAARRSL